MDIKLTILDGAEEQFSRRISLPCVIGRSKQASISIIHPLVSRQHCEIYEDNNIVKVRDLGSLNGTFYHNQRISRSVVVSFGESFFIGNLRFFLEKYEEGTTKIQRLPALDNDLYSLDSSEDSAEEVVDLAKLLSPPQDEDSTPFS